MHQVLSSLSLSLSLMRADKVNAAVSMLLCEAGPKQLALRSILVQGLGLTDQEWVAVDDESVKDAF